MASCHRSPTRPAQATEFNRNREGRFLLRIPDPPIYKINDPSLFFILVSLLSFPSLFSLSTYIVLGGELPGTHRNVRVSKDLRPFLGSMEEFLGIYNGTGIYGSIWLPEHRRYEFCRFLGTILPPPVFFSFQFTPFLYRPHFLLLRIVVVVLGTRRNFY